MQVLDVKAVLLQCELERVPEHVLRQGEPPFCELAERRHVQNRAALAAGKYDDALERLSLPHEGLEQTEGAEHGQCPRMQHDGEAPRRVALVLIDDDDVESALP